MDMGKYVAVGVLAMIILAAATYESPNKKKTAGEGETAAASSEEPGAESPVFEATFGAAPELAPPAEAPVGADPAETQVAAVTPAGGEVVTPGAEAGGEAPAPAPSPEIAQAAKELKEYTVKAGQTLSDIAEELLGDRKRWKALYDANKDRLPSPDRIREGMKLVYGELVEKAPAAKQAVTQAASKALPASAPRASGGRTYTVAKGETLYAISRKTLGKGGRWQEIAQLNGLPEGKVRAGQVLKLPQK